jgi:hypothetical protein
MPHHQGITLVGFQQAGKDRDGSGLARAIRTQQAEYLTTLHLKRYVFNRMNILKLFVERDCLDGRLALHGVLLDLGSKN